jgi:hypothetical protein
MAKNKVLAKSKVISPTDSKAKESKDKSQNTSDIETPELSAKKTKNKSPKDKQQKKSKNSEEKTHDKALIWEPVKSQFKPNKQSEDVLRTKVPGGWFVSVSKNKGGGVFFYPDPEHVWDGNSL